MTQNLPRHLIPQYSPPGELARNGLHSTPEQRQLLREQGFRPILSWCKLTDGTPYAPGFRFTALNAEEALDNQLFSVVAIERLEILEDHELNDAFPLL